MIQGWAHTARTGRYPALAGVDVEAALAGVRLPVLAVDMEVRRLIHRPPDGRPPDGEAVRRGEEVVRQHSAAEAGSPIDHFTWVRHGTPLAGRVAAWAATV